MRYIGRFAPSPTGPLHFGSLVAALASYLDARHNQGRWLLRIEDLDPPRESESAPAAIMNQLKALGLLWDGEVLFQNTRLGAYADALAKLKADGRVFPCTCTRKATPPIYPGTCRNKRFENINSDYAIRFQLNDKPLLLNDRVFGEKAWVPGVDLGDPIIRRKDGLFAYQLAVVVDDDFQRVTQVVRGADLLDSTPWQIALIDALGIAAPGYLHIPVLTDSEGQKLSKQSHAKPLDTSQPIDLLRAALRQLGQAEQADAGNVAELLKRASAQWQPVQIPRHSELKTPSTYL